MTPRVATAAIALGVAAVCGVLAGVVLDATGIALPFLPGASATPPAGEPSVVPGSTRPSSTKPSGDTSLDPRPSVSVPTQTRPPDFIPAFLEVNTGVLRVLATTCAGSGVSSGFLVGRRTLVTALAAVTEPAAIAVLKGGRPIPATVRAIDPKRGLAVLRLAAAVPGHVFSADNVQLAAGSWVGVAGRPLGSSVTVPSTHQVTATGKTLGGMTGLAQLDGAADAGLSGAPLIDTKGRAIGMIVPGGGPELLAVPGAALKAAAAKPANSNPKKGNCGQPAGPRIATTVVYGDASAAVRATLKRYFSAINSGDYNTAYDQLGPAARGASRAQAANGWRSTYDFNIQILAAHGSQAWVNFDSIFAAGKGPPGTATCARWSLNYTFVETGGNALINRVQGHNRRLYRRC